MFCLPRHEGVCVVCFQSCRTRACKCSYMHKECAQKYKQYSPACTICNRTLFLWFLERRPPDSSEDLKLEAQQSKLRLLRERAMATRLSKWEDGIWPHLLRILDHRPRDPYSVLVHISFDDYRITFLQRMYDAGLKPHDIAEIHEEIEWAKTHYIHMGLKLRRQFKASMMRSYRRIEDESDDPFDEF